MFTTSLNCWCASFQGRQTFLPRVLRVPSYLYCFLSRYGIGTKALESQYLGVPHLYHQVLFLCMRLLSEEWIYSNLDCRYFGIFKPMKTCHGRGNPLNYLTAGRLFGKIMGRKVKSVVLSPWLTWEKTKTSCFYHKDKYASI